MTPPKQNNSTTRHNMGHSCHAWFVGFIVEARQSEAPEAVAHKPVVEKTQHKVNTHYFKLMLDKYRESNICIQIK
jgi:hypothetical protein